MYSNLLGQSNRLSQYLRCSNQKDWPSSPINQDAVEVVNEHLPGEMSKHDQPDIFCKKKMNLIQFWHTVLWSHLLFSPIYVDKNEPN